MTDPTTPPLGSEPIDPEYGRFRVWRFKGLPAVRHAVQYAVLWPILASANLLPIRVLQHLGSGLGFLLYYLARRDRRISLYQLALVFPELEPAQRKRLARRSFQSMGITLLEALAIHRIRRQTARWLRIEGEAELREAYAKGRGVVLITCHVANWEMLTVAFPHLKIRAQAMGARIANPWVNDLVIRYRQSEYVKAFQRGSAGSPRQLLQCLRNGEALFLVIDHDIPTNGVFVNFFGIPAHTPRVAAALALRHGVPVVTGFDRRLPDGTHLLRFEPIPTPDSPPKDDGAIRQLTQVYTDAIEAHIRANPEQWTWNHRRWKRRPPESSQGSAG
ncbi:MAG: lysophospholipid acyltransferase family protein [SAR324 cluster bacterium]|nr:lysophospholipid acyltransferase family protein [SAR324 cluster bacterium]